MIINYLQFDVTKLQYNNLSKTNNNKIIIKK